MSPHRRRAALHLLLRMADIELATRNSGADPEIQAWLYAQPCSQNRLPGHHSATSSHAACTQETGWSMPLTSPGLMFNNPTASLQLMNETRAERTKETPHGPINRAAAGLSPPSRDIGLKPCVIHSRTSSPAGSLAGTVTDGQSYKHTLAILHPVKSQLRYQRFRQLVQTSTSRCIQKGAISPSLS